MTTNEELTQLIRNIAPMACELESCYDLENGIRRLIDFAHASVSGKPKENYEN